MRPPARRHPRIRSHLLIAALATGVLLSGAAPAGATFPGPNGLLTYLSNDRIYQEARFIAPDGTGSRALTGDDASRGRGRWSPDGRYLVYDGPSRQLTTEGSVYMLDVNTGAERWIPCGPHCSSPSWSADGERLLVVRNPHPNQGFFEFTPGIYSIALDGSDPKRIIEMAPGDGVGGPVMSSDGAHIAYTMHLRSREHPLAVWVARADGSGAHQVDLGSEPDFSPDATRLAYTTEPPSDSFSAAERTRIVVSNLDGTARTFAVSDPDMSQNSATWSPDGTQIAFQAWPFPGAFWEGPSVSRLLATRAPQDGLVQAPGPNSPGCFHGYRIIVEGRPFEPSWGSHSPVEGLAGRPGDVPCPGVPAAAQPARATLARQHSPRLSVRTTVRPGQLRVRVAVATRAQGRVVVTARQRGHAMRRRGRAGTGTARTYRYVVRRRGTATIRVRFAGRAGWASATRPTRRVRVRP